MSFKNQRLKAPINFKIWVIYLAILQGLLFISLSHAQASTGIAMHGLPKYTNKFKHFDYVNPKAPKGGLIKLSGQGSFDNLNPFIAKGESASGLSYTYDTLMISSEDEAFSKYCLVCETVSIPKDRSWVKFKIRKDARFHDGTPITVEDIIFSFNVLTTKGSPFYKMYYRDVKSVQKKESDTVLFTFKVANNRELPLIIGELPILSKKYYENIDFSKTTLTPPLSSGPYKITKVDPGHTITYSRVEDYWAKDHPVNKGRYNFDKLSYDFYRDENVLLEAFKSQEYDFRQENVSKFWATAYSDVETTKGIKFKKEELSHELPRGMQGFVYNIRKPFFQNIHVRHAISLLFDFEWSNRALFYGQYKRTKSFFENSELASEGLPSKKELELLTPLKSQLPDGVFLSEFKLQKTDGKGNIRPQLRQALKLFRKAGWSLKDGKVINPKTNQPLTFEVLLVSPAFERIVLPFKKNLAKLGINLTVRIVSSAQYMERLRTFDYDMIIWVYGQSLSPGNEQMVYWGSSSADQPGSRNFIGIKNKAIDALIQHVIYAKDRKSLITAAKALDRALLNNYYMIPHWHLNYFRLAYWDKFSRPSIRPKYALGLDTWWIKSSL